MTTEFQRNKSENLFHGLILQEGYFQIYFYTIIIYTFLLLKDVVIPVFWFGPSENFLNLLMLVLFINRNK